MRKDLSEIAVVLDESGSMQSILKDTIGGYNSFIDTQKKLEGEARLTLIKFNTRYTVVHSGTNVKDVPELNDDTYSPGGFTALLDAVGKTIDDIGKRLSSTHENDRPGKVILMIITDGEENASVEYSLQTIKEKIEHQQKKYAWEVLFLGADQDSWSNAGAMGIAQAANFNKADIGKMFMGATLYCANSRSYSENTSIDNFNISKEETEKELDKYITSSKTA